jgi:hypothetical protein
MIPEGVRDLKKFGNFNISYTLTIEVVDKNIKGKKKILKRFMIIKIVDT